MTTKRIVAIVAVVALVALAVLAYSFFRTPQEASGPIEAPPVSESTQSEAEPAPVLAPTAAEPEPQLQLTATPEPPPTPETPVASTDSPLPTPAAGADSPLPTPTPAEEGAAPAGAAEAPASPTIFEITQAESEARFLINEVLRGEDKTVVGATDQVAGQIAIDPADLAATQVGAILINARTLETDSSFRNRAIKNRILLTDDYEFVTFEPLEIRGLPAEVEMGASLAFQIAGNLTVTDVTKEVVFDVTVTPVADDRIEGLATTTILYKDFNLAIPDAPAVDAVEDEVILQLQFVAVPI